MKKYFFSLIFSITVAQAGLVDAIALLVNNTPITLYEIDHKMETLNVSNNKAVELLVDEVLYKQLLKKYNIEVDSFDVDDYMQKLADSNKMTLFEFKNAVRQQQDYDKFKADLTNQLKHQKLISNIASNKIAVATTDDLRIYYNNHQKQFKVADKIEVVHYRAKNKKLLEKLKKNPMFLDKNILTQKVVLEQNKLSPQIKFIVNKTDAKTFSAIFVANKYYNMFYIVEKKDIKTIKFEDVKDKIFQIVMKQREDEYLKNYFETLKLTADIKILR